MSVTKQGFGQRLKAFAKAQYGTVGAMVELLGVDQTQFSKWVAELNRPGWDKLVLLHDDAGMSLDWLITGEGPMLVALRRTEAARMAVALQSIREFADWGLDEGPRPGEGE